MKVIIAGSRGIYDTAGVREAIRMSGFAITQIVSGGARGVDQAAIDVAMIDGVSFKVFMADWDELGKSAGHIRNNQMAAYADALIAIWDGKSPGTKNMIETAKKEGLKVFVRTIQ